MSNDVEHYRDPDNATVAQFLLENDSDALTDILVAALDEAFRILGEEIGNTTVH
jgi:DNA-binding protein YbaB